MDRLVTDLERRARIGTRHALARSARVQSAEEAACAVVCLHATDPPSVHLSCWARTDDVAVDDVERALYVTRTMIRQQSMRETIFVFPRDLVPAVWGSAAARVAMSHRKRFVKDLERWGSVPQGEGAASLAAAERAVLDHLADGIPRSSARVREAVPEASGFIVQAPDKAWGGKVAIAPKVLTQLNLDGVVARADNAGAWYASRPTWTTTETWVGQYMPEAREARKGYAELVDRWACGRGLDTGRPRQGATETARRSDPDGSSRIARRNAETH